MLRLAFTLYSMIGTTLGGMFVIGALVSGYDTLIPIASAAAAGFVVAIPAAIVIARRITS